MINWSLILHRRWSNHLNHLASYANAFTSHPGALPDKFPCLQLSRIFGREDPLPTEPPANAPKGLYLYGDVGTGKTMLMDLFYHTLPLNITRKRRVHFHAFMIDVHKRVHAAKTALGLDGGDPILPVAQDLANEAAVLCFDEFQVGL